MNVFEKGVGEMWKKGFGENFEDKEEVLVNILKTKKRFW